MAKLSVHPHQGYLNTKFTIQSFSRNHKMVKITPKDNRTPLLHENDFRPILSFELLDDQTLQLQETFPFPGRYVIEFPDDKDSAVEIEVKDAIKFGGSTHKNSYIFDETPWCFIVMKDRTYFYNRDSGEEYVESISPDKISYVNKDIVLLSNDKHKENTLYSLTEQAPIITFTDDILLQDDILIVKDETDNTTKLNVYRFTDTIIDKKEYEYEDFSACKDCRILCVYENQQIDVISLDSFETIKTVRCDNKFIKFTNGHYFIELKQQKSCTILSVKDVLSHHLWHISSTNPFSACENTKLADVTIEKDKVDKLFNLAIELNFFDNTKPQLLGGIDISYKYIEIQEFFVLSKRLYYPHFRNSFILS